MDRRSFSFLSAVFLASCAGGTDGPGKTPDDDCDPSTEAVETEREVWVDADGDGYTTEATETICAGDTLPAGYAAAASAEPDCDDDSPTAFPGAPEVADDGIDQDCNGEDVVTQVGAEVYVDSGDPDCQEEVAGTREAPNCTMQVGAGLLDAGGTMYVAGGEYVRERILGGRTYRGGYDPTDWSHDPEGHPSITRQPEDDGSGWVDLDSLTVGRASTSDAPTLVEDFVVLGSSNATLTVGLTSYATGDVTFRRIRADGQGQDAVGADFLQTTGAWIQDGNVVIEDSVIGGGWGLTCQIIYMTGGSLTVRNTELSGCEAPTTATGLELRQGQAVFEDTTVTLDGGGTARGVLVQTGAQAYLTGTTLTIHGDAASYGAVATGADARLEIKASALFGSNAGSAETAGVLVEDHATLVAANSLFYGGLGTGGASSGILVRTSGVATVVNSLIDGGASDEAAAVRADNATVTLVANNLWGLDQNLLIAGALDSSSLDEIEGCAWEGCEEANLNRSEDPGFVDWESGSPELRADSVMVDGGIDPTEFGIVVDRDLVGLPVPIDGDGDGTAEFDVGPIERR